LSKKVDETADAVRTERALGDKEVVRGFAETRHRAGSWHKERRAIARIEATRLGLDIRFIVTNLDHGSAEWLYDQTLILFPFARSALSFSHRRPLRLLSFR
jgi:Transposase DDE domain group 1